MWEAYLEASAVVQVTDVGGTAKGDKRQRGSQICQVGAARVKGLKAWAADADGSGE